MTLMLGILATALAVSEPQFSALRVLPIPLTQSTNQHSGGNTWDPYELKPTPEVANGARYAVAPR